MWYFDGSPGLPLAVLFAVLTAMALVLKDNEKRRTRAAAIPSRPPRS